MKDLSMKEYQAKMGEDKKTKQVVKKPQTQRMLNMKGKNFGEIGDKRCARKVLHMKEDLAERGEAEKIKAIVLMG